MQPDLILTPFGENADPSTIRTIPETVSPSDPKQNASWSKGFPIATMTAISAGGVPPEGKDLNGVLNAISEHTVFTEGGGQYRWSDEYVAAKGGYAKGAVIQSDSGDFSYISTIDGNSINFNSDPSSIGDEWLLYSDYLLRKNLSLTGDTMIGITGTGKTLFEIFRDRIFPGLVTGFVTTSSRGIVSVDVNDDKSAALQLLFDECSNVEIDTQIAINDTVTVHRARSNLKCSPGGTVLNGPGMAQKSMIKVTGSKTDIDLMWMDNPLLLKASSGGRQTAINIQADDVTVRNSYFKNMLHSVMTESNGEWRGSVYFNNIADECLGTGPGASDDGSSGLGEDRGDAFLIWGATGAMLFNKAFCKAGQDARIAFHCESLGNGYHTKPDNPARDGFDYWMIGNYAFGNFRRHFAFEAVKRGIMSDCISGGGATWWPVALTGGSDCISQNMTILYDRPASNTAGAAWSPARAAVAIGHNGTRNTMRNFEVTFADGAVGACLTSLVTNNKMYGVLLQGMNFYKPIGQGGLGMVCDNLPDVRCFDCHVQGAQHGMTTFGAQDNWIKGFSAYDLTGDAIRLTGGGGITAHARVEGGRFERVNNGVVANNLTSLSWRGTQLKGVAVNDLNQFGTTGAITIEGLHNENGTGKLVGMGSPFTEAQVRNVENNIGFSYDFRYILACFTSAASAANTLGKYAGKRLMRSDGVMLMALGATPTSPWGVITTATPVTPA